MKTKWHLFILWSVLSLSLLTSAVNSYESPFTRRKRGFTVGAPRTKPIKLPVAKDRKSSRWLPASTPPAPQRGYRWSYSTSAPVIVRLMRPGKPDAKIQSDFAHLPDVSLTCSTSDFVLRIKPAFYGLGAGAEELVLGTGCKSNGVLRPYGDLLFTYPLTACGGVREMLHGYLAYKYVLYYAPSPKRFPGRAHRMAVDIECRYPRDHHVHQLAVQPTWETVVFRKRLKSRHKNYQITLMDDSWSRAASSYVYQLGQKINIQVSAPLLPAGGKLYISSCYATPSSGSKSSLKYNIVDNFGCMLDSKQDLTASHFVSRTDKTLRLSFRAFQFTADPNTEVGIHCRLVVTSEGASPVHKSCTYRDDRWTALTGDDSICECCESQCVTPKPQRSMMEGSVSSASLLVSDQPYTVEDQSLPVSLREEQKTINHYADEMQSHSMFWGNVDGVKYDDAEEENVFTTGGMPKLNLDGFGFREGVLKGKWNDSELKNLNELREEGSLYDKRDLEERDERPEHEVSDVEEAIHLNQKESEAINDRVQLEQVSRSEVDVQTRDSKDEEENKTRVGKEGRRRMAPEVQWKSDSSLMDVEDGEEMTWYFFFGGSV